MPKVFKLCAGLLLLALMERAIFDGEYLSQSMMPDSSSSSTTTTSSSSVSVLAPPPPHPPPPTFPACSAEDKQRVARRWPPIVIQMQSRCPEPSWWYDYLFTNFFVHEYDGSRPLVSVNFGCNMGDDALAALKLLALNATIDVNAYLQALAHASGKAKHEGHDCFGANRYLVDEYPERYSYAAALQQIARKHNVRHRATSHCVEAMPITAHALQKTVQQLSFHYDDAFHITHAAMAKENGVMYFPNANQVGQENAGLGACATPQQQQQTASCQQVTTYTADTFVQTVVVQPDAELSRRVQADASRYQEILHQNNPEAWAQYQPHFQIDNLLVDVEGYDWQVLGLGGADWTLRHARYLEFEYHNQGFWGKTDTLKTAIPQLAEFGFVCYWPGRRGKLVRITDCWQDYFDFHDWSNVACANRYLAPDLARTMEETYQSTLATMEDARQMPEYVCQKYGWRPKIKKVCTAT